MTYYSVWLRFTGKATVLASQWRVLDELGIKIRLNRLISTGAPIGILVALLAIGLSCPARAQVTVPAVACSGNWDQTPEPLPRDGNVGVTLSSSIASKLEMYLYDKGMLLGPRGWRCSEHVRATFITIQIYPSVGKHDGAGISMQAWVGEDPWANQSIIQMAGRYFPNIIKSEYVLNLLNDDPDLKAEKELGEEKFLVPRYLTDQLKYLNSSELEFVTPSGKRGLGTIAFDSNGDVRSRQTSVLETIGVVCLINEPRPAYQLLMFSTRLSKNDADLLVPIQAYGESYFRSLSQNNCHQT